KRVAVAKAAAAARPYPHVDHPSLSLILLSFNHRQNIVPILERLRRIPPDELIVCDDGSVDGSEQVWLRRLTQPNDFVVRSNDLHEIRAYNRAVDLARGDIVCVLQDDDIPPEDGTWVAQALGLFERHERLGILGGFLGTFLDWSGPPESFGRVF